MLKSNTPEMNLDGGILSAVCVCVCGCICICLWFILSEEKFKFYIDYKYYNFMICLYNDGEGEVVSSVSLFCLQTV